MSTSRHSIWTGNLSGAECKLLAGAATGTLADLRAGKTTVT